MKKLKKILNDLFEEIKHGDQEHQDWLKAKIEDFYIKLKEDEKTNKGIKSQN